MEWKPAQNFDIPLLRRVTKVEPKKWMLYNKNKEFPLKTTTSEILSGKSENVGKLCFSTNKNNC